MRHVIEWFNMEEPYDSLGYFPYDPTDDLEAYICPKCGKRTEYWEGHIDEDPMGGAIHGYTFDCYDCKIHSAAQELD